MVKPGELMRQKAFDFTLVNREVEEVPPQEYGAVLHTRENKTLVV